MCEPGGSYHERVVNLEHWGRTPIPEWYRDAECAWHLTLPWVDEKTPTPEQQQTMAEVCAQCPVLALCANHAARSRDIAGGFYAGVWIPWKAANRAGQMGHRKARRALKRKLTEIPEVR